jgi:signal transduction histidine kinase
VKASGSRELDVQYQDLRRSERTMIMVRWAAVPWALFQVLSYSVKSYPSGYKAMGLGLIAALVMVNVLAMIGRRRATTLETARLLGMTTLVADILLVSGFVWLFAFDPTSALWAVLFILPLEGAIRFQLRGALGAWALVTVIYTLREIWGSSRYDYLLEWNSITFRMGIGFLIALGAGLLAQDLFRQRVRLAEALEELRELDEMRAGLVSTLAHDVRSPLTVIRGTISTLLKRGPQLTDEQRYHLLESADRQANRLQRLATDLLDLARLEQGKLSLDMETVDLAECIETALTFVDPEGQFNLAIEPGVMVKADPHRLEQILVNLVANALEYGQPPYQITSDSENSLVKVSVCDQGPGVPDHLEPTLFDPFKATTARGSVGYGLRVVRALAEAHGGKANYAPNEPSGARFEVTLPMARNGR